MVILFEDQYAYVVQSLIQTVLEAPTYVEMVSWQAAIGLVNSVTIHSSVITITAQPFFVMQREEEFFSTLDLI